MSNIEIIEKAPIRIPKHRRFDIWVEAKRRGITNQEIAARLGISEVRLNQHIHEWKEDGTFDRYLFSEWLIKYDALTERDDLKTTFQALTNMLMKRMKEQVELQGDVEYILKWADETESQRTSETI